MPAGGQVAHFGRLRGLSRRDASSRAHALLGELGLEDRWGDRTDKLSGGMQQRLQLATSLVHDPEVIVLDEPFAGLDPVAVASLSETLRLRARDGRTVLFSSHQLDLVQDLCEDIAMVDYGRTVLLGSVATLRASSGRRQLRLHVEAPNRDWLFAFPGLTVVSVGRLVHLPPCPVHHRSPGEAARGDQQPGALLTQGVTGRKASQRLDRLTQDRSERLWRRRAWIPEVDLVVSVTRCGPVLGNRLVKRNDAGVFGGIRTDVHDLCTGPFLRSLLSHRRQGGDVLLGLRFDDGLLDDCRIDGRELHDHRPPVPLIAIGLIHACRARSDALHGGLGIGALHPPQRLQRHHAGRTTRGLLQHEVRAVAH